MPNDPCRKSLVLQQEPAENMQMTIRFPFLDRLLLGMTGYRPSSFITRNLLHLTGVLAIHKAGSDSICLEPVGFRFKLLIIVSDSTKLYVLYMMSLN